MICTPEADWQSIQDSWAIAELGKYIELVHVPLEISSDVHKMKMMSVGHGIVSQMAFEAGASAVYLTPDLVLSDGSMRRLRELSKEGTRVVLCAALRFAYEGNIEELEAQRQYLNRLGLDGEATETARLRFHRSGP